MNENIIAQTHDFGQYWPHDDAPIMPAWMNDAPIYDDIPFNDEATFRDDASSFDIGQPAQPTQPAQHATEEYQKMRPLINLLWGTHHGYFWRLSSETYTKRDGTTDKRKESEWALAVPPTCATTLRGKDAHTYFGVAPCVRSGEKWQRGSEKGQKWPNFAHIRCFYADFDASDFDDELAEHKRAFKEFVKGGGNPDEWSGISPEYGKAAALEHIKGLSLQPSAIIDTVGGYQCYWLLDVPTTDFGRWKRISSAFVQTVGADDGAKDLARVLRIAGTYNIKPHYAVDDRLVRLVEMDLSRSFTIDEIEEYAGTTALEKAAETKSIGAKKRKGVAASGVVMAQDGNYKGVAAPKEAPPVIVAALELMTIAKADEYDTWITCGLALFNESQGADWGLELWDSFSQRSKKYDDGQCATYWADFSQRGHAGRKVGAGTLIKWACDDVGGDDWLADFRGFRTKADEVAAQMATDDGGAYAALFAAEEAIPHDYRFFDEYLASGERQNLKEIVAMEDKPSNSETITLELENGYVPDLATTLAQVKSRMSLFQSPTGTGKTYSFINAPFDGILAVPLRSIGRDIASQYGITFVDGNTMLCTSDLTHNGAIKCAVTYDSLGRLCEFLESQGHEAATMTLGIDEIHLLAQAFSYRPDAVDALTIESARFGRVVAFTATPNPPIIASFLKPAARITVQMAQKSVTEVVTLDRNADIIETAKLLREKNGLDMTVIRIDDRAQCDELAGLLGKKAISFHSKRLDTITNGKVPKGTEWIVATSSFDVGLSIMPDFSRYGMIWAARTFLQPETLEQGASRFRNGKDFKAPCVIAVQSREAKDKPINMEHDLSAVDEALKNARNKEIARATSMLNWLALGRQKAALLNLDYGPIDAALDEITKGHHVYKTGARHHDPYYINMNSIDATLANLRDKLMTTGGIIEQFKAKSTRFDVRFGGKLEVDQPAEESTTEKLKESRKARKAARIEAYNYVQQRIDDSASADMYLTDMIADKEKEGTDEHTYAMKFREIQKLGGYTAEKVSALMKEQQPESKNKLTSIVSDVKKAQTLADIEGLHQRAEAFKDAEDTLFMLENIQIGDKLSQRDIEILHEQMGGLAGCKIAESPQKLRKWIKRHFLTARARVGNSKNGLQIEVKRPFKAELV